MALTFCVRHCCDSNISFCEIWSNDNCRQKFLPYGHVQEGGSARSSDPRTLRVGFSAGNTIRHSPDQCDSWLRHPSYFGFFYWGLGTQMVLQNPVSFVGYALVMWRFFNSRIKGMDSPHLCQREPALTCIAFQVEEVQLVKFFGNDYVNYRTRVGTGIPFIR